MNDINPGTSSGSASNLDVRDGNLFTIHEVNGTPGFIATFEFHGVTVLPSKIMLYGYYDGNPAHNVILEAYNFFSSSWIAVTGAAQDFPAAGAIGEYLFTFPGSDYVSGAQAKIRIRHSSAGNMAHDFIIDEFVLIA